MRPVRALDELHVPAIRGGLAAIAQQRHLLFRDGSPGAPIALLAARDRRRGARRGRRHRWLGLGGRGSAPSTAARSRPSATAMRRPTTAPLSTSSTTSTGWFFRLSTVASGPVSRCPMRITSCSASVASSWPQQRTHARAGSATRQVAAMSKSVVRMRIPRHSGSELAIRHRSYSLGYKQLGFMSRAISSTDQPWNRPWRANASSAFARFFMSTPDGGSSSYVSCTSAV